MRVAPIAYSSSSLEAEGVRRARAGVGDDRLRLEVLVERLDAELAAEARLLEAAEGDAGERGVRHVDADRARLHLLRDAMAARRVARPHRRHQPVAHIVREPDSVCLVVG